MSTSTARKRRSACAYPRALALIGVFLIVCVQALFSQGNAITLTLTKTSNAPTPVPSGQAFTYTLAYGWSGGAPGTLVITDAVPPELDIISTLPASTITGNTVTFNISGLTASAGAGTVQINVRFKPGVTCPGTRACNTARIQVKGNDQGIVNSNQVCNTATAQNKWTFEKSLIAGCALDNDVIFRICVMNPSGGDVGGLNLTNVQLADVVPAGAVVTSVTGNWTTFTQTGTSVSLGGGPSTLPVSPWNAWYCVYLHVTFPSSAFTLGQTVVNSSTVAFNTPCDTGKKATFTDTARVTLCSADVKGSLWKGLSINIYFPSNPYYYPSFSPGCCGTYSLAYTNTGNVGQSGFVMEDNLPPTLDLTAIRTNVPAGNTPVTVSVYCFSGGICSATPCTTVTYNTAGTQVMTGLPANVCKVRWSYGGSIAVLQSLQNSLDVCVRSNSYISPFPPVLAGQNITNTVTAQATGLAPLTATHVKPVDSLRPKILATKMFMGSCGPTCVPLTAGPFVPGNIVRWRMAVANVGNVTAAPCTITDLLPSGLTYVGNPTYYYGTVNWGVSQYSPPCCSLTVTVPSEIGGTITPPSAGDTNLVWTFPTLPHRCDGGVDYLVIEFDVKIGDAPPMPPGQYSNTFTFTAGNLPAPVTSNPAILTVNAIAQLTIVKEVRPKTPSGTFGASATVPPGGQAEFRLRLKNTGNMTLDSICLLDIMPHVSDIMVLPGYGLRNSQFDMPITAAGNVSAPGSYAVGFNTAFANTKNPSRTAACLGFCTVTDPGPGVGFGSVTPGSFVSFGGSTYSFTVSGGSTTLAPGATLDVFATGTVPANATPGQNACNNFAVRAHPVGTPACLSTQSVVSCVTVGQQPSNNCEKLWLEGRADSCCTYRLTLSNGLGAIASLHYNVIPIGGSGPPSGTVQSVQTAPCLPTSTSPGSLAGTVSGTLNFNPACTQNSPLNLAIEAQSASASGEICIELTAVIVLPNGNKLECRDTICFRCRRATLTRCDSMVVKPFPYPNLDLSGRTFKIFNLKSPASPICSVKITVVPYPSGPGVNGGGLYVDGVWKSWPFGTSVGYSQILTVHGLPASNTVQFNLGIDYTIGWVGNVLVTAYHCDGDSCTMNYGPWKATPKDIIVVGTPVDIKDRAKLHVYRMAFPREKARGKNIHAIALRHGDPVESIVAVSGASFECDTAGDCDDLFEATRVKDRLVFVTLRHALETGRGKEDPYVTILYSASNNERPKVDIVYYDDTGNEVGRDSAVVVTGSTLSDVGDPSGLPAFLGSLDVRPNPTAGRCDIGFMLPNAATVDLELLDLTGNRVSTVIRREHMNAGEYRRTVDLSSLPNGSYLVMLRVNDLPTVMRVELIR